MKPPKPTYVLTYRCAHCGQENTASDLDTPICHYCDSDSKMTLISREVITPELLADKLKASADRMMSALEGAYAALQKEQPTLSGDFDEEKELLEIMGQARKLQEHFHQLELREEE